MAEAGGDDVEVDAAVLADTTRRAGLIWLQHRGGGAPRPVWHVWHDGRAYVLTGDGEQPDPGVQPGSRALVVVRERGDRALQWWAAVAVVPPASQEWEAVAPLLAAGRLNADDPEGQRERWAGACTLLRLTPDGTARPPDASGYLAPPPPTPATTDHPRDHQPPG